MKFLEYSSAQDLAEDFPKKSVIYTYALTPHEAFLTAEDYAELIQAENKLSACFVYSVEES